MATGEQVNQGDILTCSICLEKPQSPKSLPCSHTFCGQCMSEYIMSTERRAGHKLSNYHCPVCRKVITPLDLEEDTSKWSAKLPQNLTISPVKEDGGMFSADQQNCHVCKRLGDSTQATSWCRECQEALCASCTKSHSGIKFTMCHEVIRMEQEHIGIGEAVGITEISDACPLHKSKLVELYCFDHAVLCCVLCCSVNHRKCDDVRTIDELLEDQQKGAKAFESDIKKVCTEVKKVIVGIKEEKYANEQLFKDIEKYVNRTIKSLKDKLDTLKIVFVKELNLKQDEIETITDADARQLEDFLTIMKDTLNKFTTIRKYASPAQLLSKLDKMKPEFVKEMSRSMDTIKAERQQVRFVLHDSLRSLTNLNSLGSLEVSLKEECFVKEYTLLANKLFSLLIPITIGNVQADHFKTVLLPGFNIRGGTYINEQTIVLCRNDQHKLSAVDIVSGKVTSESSETVFGPKRLAFDKRDGMLYISCFGRYIYKGGLKQNFGSLYSIKTGGKINGGVCLFHGNVCIIVGSEIQKLKINHENLESCFPVNTKCSGLNGLAVDKKNNRLIYTSSDFKVVCVSMDGKEIFSYKDDHIKQVTSVVVDSRGLIFAGDEVGRVHLISEDGKERKTLIEKCDKICKVCDVWLDSEEERLFVCGNDSVEIYNLKYE